MTGNYLLAGTIVAFLYFWLDYDVASALAVGGIFLVAYNTTDIVRLLKNEEQ